MTISGRINPYPTLIRRNTALARGMHTFMSKILIVVDNTAHIQEIAEILEKKGYSTKVLHSGEEVFRVLPQHKPEIALVAQDTPRIDHYVITAFIRHLAEAAQMKVFVIAQNAELAKSAQLNWKADAVFTGTFEPEALLDAVSAHL